MSGVALLFPSRAGNPTHTQARARTRRDKGERRERGAGTDVYLTPLRGIAFFFEMRGYPPIYRTHRGGALNPKLFYLANRERGMECCGLVME